MNVLRVPLTLLLDPALTASAKVAWMAARLEVNGDAAALPLRTRIHKLTGLGRVTIRRALAQLAESGRLSPDGAPAAATCEHRRPVLDSPSHVVMPTALVVDANLRPQAKSLYGMLQLTPGFSYPTGRTTYVEFSEVAHVHAQTAKAGLRELAAGGWLDLDQPHRHALVRFTLRNPVREQVATELDAIRRRLDRSKYAGEALMREYLSLVVDSDQFEDDAAPGFLVNPQTNERLQFDRYYPHSVAFEFNGPQHYGATERFSAEEAIAQRTRDLIKAGICAERGITLIVVRAEDLTFVRMRGKVGDWLPQRDLQGHWSAVNALESISRNYRRRSRHVKPS